MACLRRLAPLRCAAECFDPAQHSAASLRMRDCSGLRARTPSAAMNALAWPTPRALRTRDARRLHSVPPPVARRLARRAGLPALRSRWPRSGAVMSRDAICLTTNRVVRNRRTCPNRIRAYSRNSDLIRCRGLHGVESARILLESRRMRPNVDALGSA